jgi:hypothetical protein
MAVTKIKAIRGTLSKAIAYILNPEKTDEKLLVSSYGCASETAAREFEWTRKIAEQKGMNPVRIIARHVIQSFEIGEVTPELAHEIGKQFADEILGGKYEYVLTTHIDKDHVHNHLIFNAVDFVDYHAYKSYKRIYYDMREVSDRLCKENGLSVIPPSQNKGIFILFKPVVYLYLWRLVFILKNTERDADQVGNLRYNLVGAAFVGNLFSGIFDTIQHD